MRRKKETSSESLDLLLDTICNTFGGILFISLLIVILLNTTSKDIVTATVTQANMADLIEEETRRAELTSQLTELSGKVDQQKLISDVVYSKDFVQIARAFEKQQINNRQIQVDTSTSIGKSAQSQVDINQIVADQQQRQSKLNAARSEEKSLQLKVNQAIKDRSQVATIPRVTEANADPDVFFLAEGKIFGPYNAGSNDFKEVVTSLGSQLVHNSNAGLSVGANASNKQKLADKMIQRSTVSEGVRVYVWPDSYANWETVRQVLDDNGIKKHLVPCEVDTKLYFGKGSQSKSTFQ